MRLRSLGTALVAGLLCSSVHHSVALAHPPEAQPPLEAEAGESLTGPWLWATGSHAVKGDPEKTLVAATDLDALESREAAFTRLAARGIPTISIEQIGTYKGEPAAVISGARNLVSDKSDARLPRLSAVTTADLDKIAALAAHSPVKITGLAVAPDGHVRVSDARDVMPTTADRKKLAAEIAALKADVPTGELVRKIENAGETDPGSALDMAHYLQEEFRELARDGIADKLDPNNKHLWDNSHLGSIDPSKLPATGDVYRRGSYGLADEVPVKALPPIETNAGTTGQPLLYQTSMAIDSDGAGSAHKGDKDGQDTTSLTYPNGDSLDPTKTPYIILPIGFAKAHPGVKLGDVVAVFSGGKVGYAIWGDEGPIGQIGEGSIDIAKELGINPDPNNGGATSGVTYVVFPGSGDGKPLTTAQINQRGAALLAKAGGKP